MKYVVIDIETTGLDPLNHEILSIGAIAEDTKKKLPYEKLPKFHVAIKHREVKGSLFALNMNKELIGTILEHDLAKNDSERLKVEEKSGMKFLDKDAAVEEFFYWLIDSEFLQDWNFETDGREYLDQNVMFRNGKRFPVIGARTKPISFTAAGKNFATFDKKFLEALPRWEKLFKVKQRVIDPAILYVDWKNDESLPSLEECLKRGKLGNTVTHNALEDAWDTLRTLRKFY